MVGAPGLGVTPSTPTRHHRVPAPTAPCITAMMRPLGESRSCVESQLPWLLPHWRALSLLLLAGGLGDWSGTRQRSPHGRAPWTTQYQRWAGKTSEVPADGAPGRRDASASWERSRGPAAGTPGGRPWPLGGTRLLA